ncbi:TPA: hypothetical protein ACX6QK_002597 [Photobacterium damselae]
MTTTNLEHTTTMDVSKENDTYYISKDNLLENMKVGASSWLLSSTNHFEARLTVLKMIFKLIHAKMPHLSLWYLVGDSAWQNDTRIIRHKKLFKRLNVRGGGIEHSTKSIENMLENEGKLKFFAAACISESSINSVIKTIAKEPCSYIVAIPDSFDINSVLNNGWESSNYIDRNILNNVIESRGLLFKIVGAFDDQESGFVGFGMPELITELEQ